MDLEFRFGKVGQRPPDGGDGARLLVIGDFSGGRASGSLMSRPFHRANAEAFDALMDRLAPRIALAVGGADGGPTTLDPRSPEDLHPDALFGKLPAFAALAAQRRRIQDPTAFASPAGDDSATMERLLGARRVGEVAQPSGLEGWLRDLVAPHVTPASHPHQGALVAALDEVISHTMRQVLRDPAFRAAEAVWTGLRLLVGDADAESVEVTVLDVSREELDSEAAQLGSRLASARPGFALVVAAFTFGPSQDDLALLEALGAAVGSAGLSLLAAADPALVGAAGASALLDPQGWSEPSRGWAALRARAAARHIGLVTPRVLLRRPYGPRSEPIEAMPFDELAGVAQADGLAWGNPALACARMIAAGFREAGAVVAPGEVSVLDDLPLHTVTEAGERVLQPCAEVFLPDRAVEALLARGVTALVSARDRPSIRVPRFQSIAAPAAPLAGPWQE